MSVWRASAAWLIALGLFAGCSNPVCDDEILTRLRQECAIALGAVSAGVCASDGTVDEIRQLDRDLCEIVDPDADADCLRDAPCDVDPASLSECFDGGGSDPGPDTFQCVQTAMDCAFDCPLDEFDSCSACALDCQSSFAQCTDS